MKQHFFGQAIGDLKSLWRFSAYKVDNDHIDATVPETDPSIWVSSALRNLVDHPKLEDVSVSEWEQSDRYSAPAFLTALEALLRSSNHIMHLGLDNIRFYGEQNLSILAALQSHKTLFEF